MQSIKGEIMRMRNSIVQESTEVVMCSTVQYM